MLVLQCTVCINEFECYGKKKFLLQFSFDDVAKYGGVFGDNDASALSGMKVSALC